MFYSALTTSAGLTKASSRLFRSESNAATIFGDAVQDCHEFLRKRQQSVVIDNARLYFLIPVDADLLTNLLASAIGDVSGLSSRGGVLSLGAVGGAIVIRSHHPLEIPGQALAIEPALVLAARRLQIVMDMAWEQGCGLRLTLSLPADRSSATAAGDAAE